MYQSNQELSNGRQEQPIDHGTRKISDNRQERFIDHGDTQEVTNGRQEQPIYHGSREVANARQEQSIDHGNLPTSYLERTRMQCFRMRFRHHTLWKSWYCARGAGIEKVLRHPRAARYNAINDINILPSPTNRRPDKHHAHRRTHHGTNHIPSKPINTCK